MINPSLPLADLHRHLDGNIRPYMIRALAERFNLPLRTWTDNEIAARSQIAGQSNDLMDFLEKLDLGVSTLASEDACYYVGYENMREIAREGIDYCELRFSPRYMAQAFDLDFEAVIEAVSAGVADGIKAFGGKASLIGIMSRTYGVEACQAELDAILHCRNHFSAVDLAGDETRFPAHWFTPHFNRVRDAGLGVTIHAGEAAGPDSIWQAVILLGATRIGHGIAAWRDPSLMEYLQRHDIALEVCLTSNYHTHSVTNLALHPITKLLAAGVPITLNSDDPAVSNIDLKGEYQVAAEVLGLEQDTLSQLQRNGLAYAFISDADKAQLRG